MAGSRNLLRTRSSNSQGRTVRSSVGKPMQRIAFHAVADEGCLPLAVRRWAEPSRQAIFVAGDDSMLQALAEAMPVFLPDRPTHVLPAWGSSPYDRSRPSRAVTGMRVAGLAAIAERAEPCLVVTTPEALLQRIPPAERLLERAIRLLPGQGLDLEWLQATLTAFDYDLVERVDEVGEAVIRPGAADVFPAGAASPVRLELEDGRITAMRRFDAADQLTTVDVPLVLLLPASEGFIVPGEAAEMVRPLLPEGDLATLFDLLPDAALAITEGFDQRVLDWLDLVQDGYRMALSATRAGTPPPPAPDRLYLRRQEVETIIADRRPAGLTIGTQPAEPALALAAAVRRAASLLADDRAVIACAGIRSATLRTTLARRLRFDPDNVEVLEDWDAALRLHRGRIGVLKAPLRFGFSLPDRTVLAIQTLPAGQTRASRLEDYAATLAIGDLVVEPERGVAELAGLVMEDQAGASFECLSLAFRGDANLLVPATEAGRVWRYGAAGTMAPDRLDASAWRERRAHTERELQAIAVRLVAQVREREAQAAPVFKPADAYRRFVRAMPFALTPDQARAIRSVQQDLASGHPMLRLMCGDVGFGKTEVALHAAALTALAGDQVAIAAPTTLLARQHLEVFRRRLSGLGLRIEPLIRSSRSQESRDVLQGLSKGVVHIVIGTHSVAAAQFQRLGLIVIDEEQRFGEAHKRALRRKRAGLHTLIMTATPLPRTLQGALVGVVDVSLLAQPPASRLPIRSITLAFDPVVARTALMREARRGGQSFVVCPRIQDLGPMQARLAEIVPELSIAVAHGRLRGEELDRVVLEFASGNGDVLLTTNIVETGLDISNANTMLIWRADHFGVAQLHQLRGRIGRGRVRGSAYLMTDGEHPPSPAALRRLEVAASLGGLGSGFDVSLADLEQRGAGDLLGEEQAGHLRLIGTELYRHLLTRALARARGEPVADEVIPNIVVEAEAMVPPGFIPEADVRLEIYRRLARTGTIGALDEFAEEMADRFGTLPGPLLGLLDMTRLRVLCEQHGIAAVHAGPSGIAFTEHDGTRRVLDLSPNPVGHRLPQVLEALRGQYS
jgi:transcription-repair coupling factor (superfamily II helicase)